MFGNYVHVHDKDTNLLWKPLFYGVKQYGVSFEYTFLVHYNRVSTRLTGEKEGLDDITAAQAVE